MIVTEWRENQAARPQLWCQLRANLYGIRHCTDQAIEAAHKEDLNEVARMGRRLKERMEDLGILATELSVEQARYGVTNEE